MEEDEERQAGRRGEKKGGGSWAYNQKHSFVFWIDSDTLERWWVAGEVFFSLLLFSFLVADMAEQS